MMDRATAAISGCLFLSVHHVFVQKGSVGLSQDVSFDLQLDRWPGLHMITSSEVGSRNGRFGSYVNQIGPKWNKFGTF